MSRSIKTKCELNQLTEVEFFNFQTAVQSVFDLGRQRYRPNLRLITNRAVAFDRPEREYIARERPLAVTLTTTEAQGDWFDIWITPTYQYGEELRFTLAHELVHGYTGVRYGHNAHWRRWFYRTCWHLSKLGYLTTTGSMLTIHLDNVGMRYNMVDLVNEHNLIDMAMNQAEQEHGKVREAYFRRMEATCHE